MLETRFRKIIRDILSRKVRTALVASSIFIGVLGVITLFTMRDLITEKLDEDVKTEQLAMIEVEVRIRSDVEEVDNDTYLATLNRQNERGQAIDGLEGIEQVEGQAFYSVSFRAEDENSFREGELRAYATPLQEVKIEPVRLVEGDWPTVGQNEVVLEKRMAERFGFSRDDTIIFRTVSATGVGEERYTVSGIVFHPYSYRGLDNANPGPDVGIYAQYDDAQDLLNFAGLSFFVARYETFELAQNNYEDFQGAINEETPYIVQLPTIENPAENEQVVNAQNFGNILSILALLTMVVSGFLVVNVINTIVVEQKQQIGVMKSLGASERDIFLMYGGIALSYGIIGTLPAIVVGIIAGYQFTLVLAPTLDILIEAFDWSPISVFIGTLMGILVPILAALLPVYNGSRVTIMEAMTDLGISKEFNEGFLSRLVSRLPLPIIIRQAITNLLQRKGRLALTGITLTLAAASFMGVVAVAISLNDAIQDIFDRLGYEILLAPNEIRDPDEMDRLIRDTEGVEDNKWGVVTSVQVEGDYTNFFTGNDQLGVFGINPEDRAFNFNLVEGEGWEKDPTRDGVIISRSISRQLDLATGDQIAFFIGGQRFEKTILGIDAMSFDNMWFLWPELSRLAGISEPSFKLATIPGQTLPVPAIGVDGQLVANLLGRGLAENEIVITPELAEGLGIQVGDALNLEIESQADDYHIAGIFPINELAPEAPASAILINRNVLLALSPNSSAAAQDDTSTIPNAYYILVNKDDPTVDDVDDIMSRLTDNLLERGISVFAQNQVQEAENLTEIVVQNTSILGIAAVLIAAVGAIGLLTTLTINVFERQKEIGVMRSIGASSSTITLQFLTEGLIVGTVAWLIGVPLSYFIAVGINAALQIDTVEFSYPPEVVLIGLVGMLVITALASIGPALNAANKTVSDIIRYQ
jgi:putative ABC transport system permease protein